MKKSSVIFVLSILAFSALKSQDSSPVDTRQKFQIGVKAGANYANVYDESGDQFRADGKLGLALGGFVRIPILKQIGIQPEILYSQKGFKGSGTLLGNSYNFSRTTNYLDVPILFAFKPSPYVTFLGGPQFSYLLSQKDEFTSTLYSNSQMAEFNLDDIRNNLFGFALGIDANFENFLVSARACWDVSNNHADGTRTTPRYKNMWFQLTLGYRIY